MDSDDALELPTEDESDDAFGESTNAIDLRVNTTWWLVLFCSLATTLCGMELMLTNGNMIYIVGSIGITPDESTWIIAGFFAMQLVGIAVCTVIWRCLTVRVFLLLMSSLYIFFELYAAHCGDFVGFALSRLGAGFVNGSITTITLVLIMRKIPSDRRHIAYFFFGTPPILTVPLAYMLAGFCINHTSWRDMYYISAAAQLLLLVGFYRFSHSAPVRPRLILRLSPNALALIVSAAFSFTILMMRGTTENWIDSPFIQALVLISCSAFCLLLFNQLSVKAPLLNFGLCRDPHFLAITAINFVFGCILAYTFVVAGFLVLTQDYNSLQIGIAVLLAAVTAPISLGLNRRVDPRVILLLGILFFVASGVLNANVTRLEDGSNIVFSQILRSFGQTLLLWPLWELTIKSVEPKNYEHAAKIYTFVRCLGVVTGIGAIGAFQTWRDNFHSVHVMETLNDFVLKSDIARLQTYFISQGATLPDASNRALALIVKHVRAENTVLVFGDLFWLVGVMATLACIPLLFVRGNGRYSIFELLMLVLRIERKL